jgi:hypothetical protein
MPSRHEPGEPGRNDEGGSIGPDRFMAESIDAHERGIDLEEYFAARAADITHGEVILAHDAEVDIGYYTVARKWATHDEVLAEIARHRAAVSRDPKTGAPLRAPPCNLEHESHAVRLGGRFMGGKEKPN